MCEKKWDGLYVLISGKRVGKVEAGRVVYNSPVFDVPPLTGITEQALKQKFDEIAEEDTSGF